LCVRGEAASGGGQPVNSPPPIPEVVLPGGEGAGEIPVAAHAAYNVVQVHVLKAQIAHVAQLQFLAHLFKG
jgi:hypothetical protein